MNDRAAIALAEAANTIHAAARAHKLAEFAHRKQARDLMRRYELLRRELGRLGIDLETTQAPGKGVPQ